MWFLGISPVSAFTRSCASLVGATHRQVNRKSRLVWQDYEDIRAATRGTRSADCCLHIGDIGGRQRLVTYYSCWCEILPRRIELLNTIGVRNPSGAHCR